MTGALAWFGVGLWLVSLPSLGWYWRGRWERRRRRYRRGGFVRPRASGRMKDGGRRTPATGITARISSYSLRGSASEAWDFPQWPPLRSRLGARTSSGNATAARGANGARPDGAAFAEEVARTVAEVNAGTYHLRPFAGGSFVAW